MRQVCANIQARNEENGIQGSTVPRELLLVFHVRLADRHEELHTKRQQDILCRMLRASVRHQVHEMRQSDLAGRRELQELALSPRVLHVHQLPAVASRSTFHVARRPSVLFRLFRQVVRQEMLLLSQTNHWYEISLSLPPFFPRIF